MPQPNCLLLVPGEEFKPVELLGQGRECGGECNKQNQVKMQCDWIWLDSQSLDPILVNASRQVTSGRGLERMPHPGIRMLAVSQLGPCGYGE